MFREKALLWIHERRVEAFFGDTRFENLPIEFFLLTGRVCGTLDFKRSYPV